MKRMIFLIIPLLLCGCTRDFSRKEIDQIDMALVLGIDYSEGTYTLSALYSTGGGGADPGKSSDKGSEVLVSGTGKTAFEALQDLRLKNKKTLTLAQTGSFLLGEDAAKQGINLCTDFLSKDETIKMEGLVYIVKGKSAKDFMNAGIENKQTVHEDLETLKEKQHEILTRNDNAVVNVLNDMKQSYSSILIPYLISDESGYLMEGYCVFDQLKLKDYLDKDTSAGVNFVRNIMRSYPIYLEDKVGLLISFTKTKLKADVQNKVITITIKVSFDSMIKEVLADKNIYTLEELDRLTKEQNEYIKGIIEKAVSYSTKTGLDILNLARIVENQNVKEWNTISADWTSRISGIHYKYKLESRISKSFILGS